LLHAPPEGANEHADKYVIEQAADNNNNNNNNTKLILTDCKMQIRIFAPTLARIALLYFKY
jgi:hypothetical protein